MRNLRPVPAAPARRVGGHRSRLGARLPDNHRLGVRVAALLALTVCALAACGVPLQNVAQPIEGVVTASPAPTPMPTGPVEQFWFVRDDGLVPIRETTATPVLAADLLGRLAAGPPTTTVGLRSLVTDPAGGPPLVTAVADEQVREGEQVTVVLSASFAAVPASEQPLLLGQVVLTLTGAGASSVLVTDEQGAPVSVPAADGKLISGAVSGANYAALVAAGRPTRSATAGETMPG